MEQLRVCLLNDSFPPLIDGVATTVVNYGREIEKLGGKAAVATPNYPNVDDSPFPFRVYRYPSVNLTRLFGYRAGMPVSPEMYRQMRMEHYGIIHSHCPFVSSMLGRVLRDQLHVPLVFTYHTKFDVDIANTVKSPLLREEGRRMLVRNISASDEVWTVSRGAGENLRELGYEGEYRIMPNGVDLPRGRVSEEKIREVCGDYDLPENVPVYLYIGRMMWYKGIHITLEALAGLMAEGKDFRMVFVGGGGDLEEIKTESRLLGLSKKVFFVPPIQDREVIRTWYCRADLFLFPSTFDTSGLVVREAAACGLASVLIRGSCAAEEITEGRNGFMIEESADSMLALLRELYGKKQELRQVGAHAEKEIYLSWEAAVKLACDRYRVVMEQYASLPKKPITELTDDVVRFTDQLWQKIFERKD